MGVNLDVATLSRVLKHYKRPEIQQAIVEAGQNKEAVGSFGGQGYAKRPDVLVYPNDVMELVKSGVTSFHVSEEIWTNPQAIQLNMKKNEYNDLRRGWDLVLDIDCPFWEFAKITTWLFVKALQEHGIKSITSKFSGNKGFHVGVPFEAFPSRFNDQDTKDMFPEGPRKIAAFLLDYISEKHVEIRGTKIVFGGQFEYTLTELADKVGKPVEELIQTYCNHCGKKVKDETTRKTLFTCSQCEGNFEGGLDDEYKSCPKCKIIMERSVIETGKKCCSKPELEKKFDPSIIVEVDTVLIAPRHLYRAPYSYHEKSGLISVPILPEEILTFEKIRAEPAAVQVGELKFLDRRTANPEEGMKLLLESFDHEARKDQKQFVLDELEKSERGNREFEEIQTAIPEKFFPPCICAISKGLQDGKKRAVFMITNFLSSCGWDYEQIEDWLKEWNQRNAEPLRDQYYLGQVRYAKQTKKRVLPPNCDNEAYYKSFGVCKPDNFCKYVKNPANYAIRRARFAQKQDHKSKKDNNISKDKPKEKTTTEEQIKRPLKRL